MPSADTANESVPIASLHDAGLSMYYGGRSLVVPIAYSGARDPGIWNCKIIFAY